MKKNRCLVISACLMMLQYTSWAADRLDVTNAAAIVCSLKHGGNIRAAASQMFRLEREAIREDDRVKSRCVLDALSVAKAIYEMCEFELATNHSALIPRIVYDVSNNNVPIPHGIDPASISNADVRIVYEEAREEHRQMLIRITSEKQKMNEADFCIRLAARLASASSNQQQVIDMTGNAINGYPTPYAVKLRMYNILKASGISNMPSLAVESQP